MIDYALGGYNPSVYHMGNLIIYLITCLLLYRILVDQIRHSALWVVAFFALHPVHTEPVAWVSARSDLLAGFFCLLSFFAYQKSISKITSLTYAGSIIFWILAFFSKSVAVAFPIVIIGYDICVRSRPWRQNLIRWSPFIFLSIMACVFSIYRAKITGHIYDDFLFFSDRLLYIALLIQRYILTTLVPLRLSFYYTPFPDLSQIVFEVVLSLFLCLLLIMLGLFWWLKDKKKVFILILFFTFLLPVIQIIPFPVMQADRYLFYSVLSIAIICDGNNCSFDYEGAWIRCNTNKKNPGGDDDFATGRETLTIGSGKGTKINEYLTSDDGSCEGPVALTIRHELKISDNGTKKMASLDGDNVSASMFEAEFVSTS